MRTLKDATHKQIEIGLLETGRQPKTALTISLCTRTNKPIPMSVLFSTEINLVSAIRRNHQSSSSVFHKGLVYLVVPVNFVGQFLSFPACLRVLTFQVL